MTFVKFIDEHTVEEAPINKDGASNYNLNEELMLKDGYLPLIEGNKKPECLYSTVYKAKKDKIVVLYEEIHSLEVQPVDKEVQVRLQRQQMLAATDWTMCKDVHLDEATEQAYLEYRQALRDITKQKGFPDNVEWPELKIEE